jgi:NAD(P)-dependent dehydrogenase (short-subunit alcohol dehydrogenase family)
MLTMTAFPRHGLSGRTLSMLSARRADATGPKVPAVLATMSSGVASLTRQSASSDPLSTGPVSSVYSPSKTFLNALTVQYAKELAGTGVLIDLACPGFVATDLNGFRGVRTPQQQGAAIALRLATLPHDGPTGGYVEDAGVIPW